MLSIPLLEMSVEAEGPFDAVLRPLHPASIVIEMRSVRTNLLKIFIIFT